MRHLVLCDQDIVTGPHTQARGKELVLRATLVYPYEALISLLKSLHVFPKLKNEDKKSMDTARLF